MARRIGDGERVLFRTGESFSDDDDAAPGTSTRAPAGRRRCSRPGGGYDAVFIDASEDGSVVVIVTDEQLTDEDDDTGADFYALGDDGATLLSTGPTSSGNATVTAGRSRPTAAASRS